MDAGQSEPGEGKLSPGAVVLELDVKVEVSGVEEEQRTDADGVLFGFHLGTETDPSVRIFSRYPSVAAWRTSEAGEHLSKWFAHLGISCVF